MNEYLEQFNDRYSVTLRQYEKIILTANSIPFMMHNIKAKKMRSKMKEEAICLRKQITFNQNFLDVAKKYSEYLSISPYPSTAQNTLRLKSYIKDPDHLSSDMYIIKPINEINQSNDIFATTYQWKREKPKYKPKEYTFRPEKKRVIDIKDYSPNYSYIYKRVPFVKIYPLPTQMQNQKKGKSEIKQSRTIHNRLIKSFGSSRSSMESNGKGNQTTTYTSAFSFRG